MEKQIRMLAEEVFRTTNALPLPAVTLGIGEIMFVPSGELRTPFIRRPNAVRARISLGTGKSQTCQESNSEPLCASWRYLQAKPDRRR